MTELWTAYDVAAATHGQVAGDWTVNGISIDTRTLQPGDLFVALTAARDGHDFVADALSKGAAAALVSRVPDGVDPSRLVIVPDVLAGLEDLGRAARARTAACVIGITGSVGKTSTKEMLRTVLGRQGRVHAAEASYNNHWGVPLTLARMPADTDYAVIEIGMNAPGEIAPLSQQARPHVVMVTTVGAAHLEAFGSLDGIAHEKASIVAGLAPGGTAVLNADIATAHILRDAAAQKAAAIVGFGETATDWQLDTVRLSEAATVIEAHHGAQSYLFKLSLPGRHFALNALGVLAVTDAIGADPVRAAQDLALWHPPAGRGTKEVVTLDPARDGDSLDLLDDAFNANPTSMIAAFEVLSSCTPRDDVGRIAKGRRIAFLGDMLELGPEETALHAGLAEDPHLLQVDQVHCAGQRMRALYDALPQAQQGLWAETAEALAAEVTRLVDAGDVVLVKGSKGSKISRVVDAIRKLGHR